MMCLQTFSRHSMCRVCTSSHVVVFLERSGGSISYGSVVRALGKPAVMNFELWGMYLAILPYLQLLQAAKECAVKCDIRMSLLGSSLFDRQHKRAHFLKRIAPLSPVPSSSMLEYNK